MTLFLCNTYGDGTLQTHSAALYKHTVIVNKTFTADFKGQKNVSNGGLLNTYKPGSIFRNYAGRGILHIMWVIFPPFSGPPGNPAPLNPPPPTPSPLLLHTHHLPSCQIARCGKTKFLRFQA
jgi:hypothetical protein